MSSVAPLHWLRVCRIASGVALVLAMVFHRRDARATVFIPRARGPRHKSGAAATARNLKRVCGRQFCCSKSEDGFRRNMLLPGHRAVLHHRNAAYIPNCGTYDAMKGAARFE